jgi:hypothetical protein
VGEAPEKSGEPRGPPRYAAGAVSWIELPKHEVTREIALGFLQRGLEPGEEVLHLAMGQELPTKHTVAQAARDARDQIRKIDPVDAVALTAVFGAIVAADAAIAAITSGHAESVANAFADPNPPPRIQRAGFVLASTPARLILLDVHRAFVTRGISVRTYAAVRAAFAWPRPVPSTLTMRERKVLCLDTVSMRFADTDHERHVTFVKAAGFPNNQADARAIARSIAA